MGEWSSCRAGLYIRLSKEDEAQGPSQSVTNQRSILEAFAAERAISVYDVYIDDGWSGTDFRRPAFRRMLDDIDSGRVNTVITKDLSRLGRDYILTGHYLERYFPEKGVRYISLLDGIDTGVESVCNDITPFRAIMNDMYAKDISKKIKSVKRDKQRKGLFIGGKPAYGYRMHPTEKNRIVIDEDTAPVVRRIFTMAAAGTSCRRIAQALDQEGILSPAAYWSQLTGNPNHGTGKWNAEAVSRILRNETYLGNMVQGRQEKVSYKSRKCRKQPRENWIIVEGTHEALVEEALFRKAALQLASRARTRSRTYDFLLKGLIFCRECGAPLGVINRKTAAGEDRLYFICRTYQRNAGLCTCHCAREQAVTEAVSTQVRQVCRAYLTQEHLLPIARELVCSAENLRQGQAQLRTAEEKLAVLTAKLDRIYLDKLSGVLREADFQRIYGKLSSERDELEAQCAALAERQDTPVDPEETALALTRRFLAQASTHRGFLVSLIRRIELSRDGELEIHFRFRDPADCRAMPVYNSPGGIHSSC